MTGRLEADAILYGDRIVWPRPEPIPEISAISRDLAKEWLRLDYDNQYFYEELCAGAEIEVSWLVYALLDRLADLPMPNLEAHRAPEIMAGSLCQLRAACLDRELASTPWSRTHHGVPSHQELRKLVFEDTGVIFGDLDQIIADERELR